MAERFPPQVSVEAPVDPAVRAETLAVVDFYGGEDHFLRTYGVGIAELSQEVEYGQWKGPFWKAVVPDPEAMSDPQTTTTQKGTNQCPVGGVMKDRMAEDGLPGVQSALAGLTLMDKKFNLKFSAQTVEKVRAVQPAPTAEVQKKN